MLSRHSVSHFPIVRAGIKTILDQAPRSGTRILGIDCGSQHVGMAAHISELDAPLRNGLEVAARSAHLIPL